MKIKVENDRLILEKETPRDGKLLGEIKRVLDGRKDAIQLGSVSVGNKVIKICLPLKHF